MKRKTFFLSLAVAALPCMFVSCGDDDDDVVVNDGKQDTEYPSNQDPESTVVLNLLNNGTENTITMGTYTYAYTHANGETTTEQDYAYFCIYMNSSNNFSTPYDEIVSVGQVAGLSSITKIPTVGWSRQTAVVPGTGYIVRTNVPVAYNYETGWEHDYWYTRIYVVDYMSSTGGGIMGATIKYQSDWKTPDNK